MKTLVTLKKSRVHSFINVDVSDINEKNDNWFLEFKTIKNKDKTVKDNSTIIKRDLPNWINYHLSAGWQIVYICDKLKNDKEIKNRIDLN